MQINPSAPDLATIDPLPAAIRSVTNWPGPPTFSGTAIIASRSRVRESVWISGLARTAYERANARSVEPNVGKLQPSVASAIESGFDFAHFGDQAQDRPLERVAGIEIAVDRVAQLKACGQHPGVLA